MAICYDPALSYLKGIGYNVVRLPTTKLKPWDVVGKDSQATEWLGPITQLCTSSKVPPESATAVGSTIESTASGALSLGAGLRVLGDLLSAFGANAAGLRGAYATASHLQFTFHSPIISGVSPATIGEWLLGARPNFENPIVKRYFASEEGAACVVTEILTSNSFTVTALNKKQGGVDVNIAAVDSALQGGVRVESSTSRAGELRYVGQELLTFGFKAFALAHSFGLWVVSGIHAGRATLGPEGDVVPHIFDSGWLNLRDSSYLRSEQ